MNLPTGVGSSKLSGISRFERTFVYNNKLYIFSSQSSNVGIIDIDTGNLTTILHHSAMTGCQGSVGIIRYGAKAYIYSESNILKTGYSQSNYFFCMDLTSNICSTLSSIPISQLAGISMYFSGRGMTYTMFLDTAYNNIFLICSAYHYQNLGSKDDLHLYCYDIPSNSWKLIHRYTVTIGTGQSYFFKPSQGSLFEVKDTYINCISNLCTMSTPHYWTIKRGTSPYLYDDYNIVSGLLTQDFNNENNVNTYSNVIGMNDNRIAVHGNKLFKYSIAGETTSGENMLGPAPCINSNTAAYAGGISFWNNRFWYYNGQALYSLEYTT